MSIWFESGDDNQIRQGEVLLEFTVALPETGAAEIPEGEIVDAEAATYRGIVLTHSCDLERRLQDDGQTLSEPKVSSLVVAAMYLPDQLENHPRLGNCFKSSTYLLHVREGNTRNLCMLGGFESVDIAWEYAVVSFTELYQLPYESVAQLISEQGPRIRLRPPFREYLSQAFAKTFMEIGHEEEDVAFSPTAESDAKKKAINYLTGLNAQERLSLLAGMNAAD